MAAKWKAKSRPIGRPTKYKAEFAEQGYKLCLLGATDIDLAGFFDTTEATVNAWKHAHPQFLESITRGKDQADAEVAAKLFSRATGYEHPEDDIRSLDGRIVITPTIKHYPPDTPAAIFWLKNRQRAKWRDKIETELTGADGGEIKQSIRVTFE